MATFLLIWSRDLKGILTKQQNIGWRKLPWSFLQRGKLSATSRSFFIRSTATKLLAEHVKKRNDSSSHQKRILVHLKKLSKNNAIWQHWGRGQRGGNNEHFEHAFSIKMSTQSIVPIYSIVSLSVSMTKITLNVTSKHFTGDFINFIVPGYCLCLALYFVHSLCCDSPW